MEEMRDPHEKVSRLPGLPHPLDPLVAQVFEDSRRQGSHILNLHLVNAHAPQLSASRKPFIAAMRSGCKVARLYREIAIVRAAQMVGCDYEENHHKPFALQCGLSRESADAIATWAQHRDLFDAAQLAVLGFVEEMCGARGEVSDAAFAELQRHFSPQEIVELATCATSYYGGGMYMKALRIARDPDHRKPAPGRF